MEIETNESQILELDWILTDLKNTRISKANLIVLMTEATDEFPTRGGNHVLVRCPELRQFILQSRHKFG